MWKDVHLYKFPYARTHAHTHTHARKHTCMHARTPTHTSWNRGSSILLPHQSLHDFNTYIRLLTVLAVSTLSARRAIAPEPPTSTPTCPSSLARVWGTRSSNNFRKIVAVQTKERKWKKRSSRNKELILKTIGNRKGDCAWSCSRWQTQPEKICKSQRTNQCHSLRTLYWFVLCNLQIFSGCVCHLEQLHAQSPFLFPIVFSINLIPFFDNCSVDLLVLAVFQPGCSGMCYFTGPLRGRNSCCLWFWQLVFGVWLRDATSKPPSSPNPLSNRSVLHDHDGRKHTSTWESIHTSKTVVFFTIQRSPRISTSYKFAAPRYRLPPMALQTVQVNVERRRGNHMHDHSRFQRDINDVTGVSLSLSLPLTKVTDAQYRKRFRASYNRDRTRKNSEDTLPIHF